MRGYTEYMFDSHCHLDFPDFDHDRAEIIAHCLRLGIDGFIVPGVTRQTWPRLLHIAGEYAEIHPALGMHPMFTDEHTDQHLVDLDEAIVRYRPVAIGEIGLDFYIKDADRPKQAYFFVEQLKIAKHHNLPVILHVRKAHDQVLAQLRKLKLRGGIAHAFSGSEQQAYQYIDLGFKLGFGGAATYSRANRLHHLLQTLPLESVVFETDAPDMPPDGHQGERNSPEYLPEIVKSFAVLHEISPEELMRQGQINLENVLDLTCL